MKIGLDYISSFGSGGNATYTRELIKGLAKIDQKNDYYLYTYLHKLLSFYKKDIISQRNFHYRAGYFCWPYKFFKKNIENFSQQLLPRKIKKDRIDIFHLTNPLKFNPQIKNFIVTIHDLCYLKEPDFIKKSSMDFCQKNLQAILDKSQAVIAVSRATKKDILDNFKIRTDKTFVIYEGISEIFKPQLDKNYLKKKFNLNKEYILFIGQLQPRKNLPRLLKAYSQLALDFRKKYQLVIVGRSRNQTILRELVSLAARLKIKNQVRFLGYLETKDLPYLYSGATVFIYSSLYEGFGLPILESLACGTPVIASNVSSLPEVLGQAGLLVDPYNSEEIKLALEKILTEDGLRDSLIKKGLAQSRNFNWLSTAQETLNLYQQVDRYLE